MAKPPEDPKPPAGIQGTSNLGPKHDPAKAPAGIQGRSSLGGHIDFQAELDEQARRRERAAAWLRDHWTVPANCPVCASNKWTVGDVFELRRFHGGSIVVGGDPLLPLFPVVCNVCGNTVLINAVISGVLEQEPGAGTTEGDETESDDA